jgi:hypothetical protein
MPVLVTAVTRGQLKGILPMVLLNAHAAGKGDRITGAGHYEALYQTWLTAPADGDAFIKNALGEIMRQFPGHPVSFRFLPPGTSLDWIRNDKRWRQRSIVQSYVRPLINFKDPDHAKLFHKKHFKHKMNRLKRLGEVQFEKVTDLKKFESSLNEMAIMFDFRQSALFNKNPFRDDPAKKDFLLELFHQDVLHTTVLKVDGKTMAGVIAVEGKDGCVHLAGINCHAPFNSRYYSPGFMNFILLAKQLAAEGVPYFDLTPGYDAYKEELANKHDEVRELVISSSSSFRIKRQLKKWVHARLVAGGIRPMTVELELKRWLYLAKKRNPLSVLKRLAKSLRKKRTQQLYLLQPNNVPTNVNVSIHKDNLKDLLQFESGGSGGITRWEFLADAMSRMEDKQHCFTWIGNGRLLACAWFSYPDNPGNDPVTENTLVLDHLYCHQATGDRLPAFLQGVIDAAANKEGKNYFLTNEPSFCKTLETLNAQRLTLDA